MAELQIADVRAQVMLSYRSDFEEDETTFKPADHQAEALDRLCEQLVSWSDALREVRSRHLWLTAS
jgi:hypothetical protein